MNRILHIILIIIFPLFALSNAAQPGFWNAGGTGTFSLLHPEDSAQFQKIQMVKEKVSIQLYHGYAVVKGQYWMFNSTKNLVTLKTGYPKNSSYSSEMGDYSLAEIYFDSLYGLKVFINSMQVHYKTEIHSNENNFSTDDLWYVWTTDFNPMDTTIITVYFIVNTNNTSIRRGYNRDKYNGFIYLLESGASWKQPIIEGEIRLQTMDNLSIKDIHGVHPETFFSENSVDNILVGRFHKLSPKLTDNIILSYSKNIEDFNFPDILEMKDKLYQAIDLFSQMHFDISKYQERTFNDPFKVHNKSIALGLLMLLLVFKKWILLAVVLIAVLIVFIRIRKKKLRE